MLDNLMQGDLDLVFLAEQALLYWEIETIIYTCIYVYLLTYFGRWRCDIWYHIGDRLVAKDRWVNIPTSYAWSLNINGNY